MDVFNQDKLAGKLLWRYNPDVSTFDSLKPLYKTLKLAYEKSLQTYGLTIFVFTLSLPDLEFSQNRFFADAGQMLY